MTESHTSEPRIPAILRLLRLPAVTLAVAALGLVPAVASADSCPNAAFRAGPAASLPDCRAYELVSPPDTNNYDLLFGDDAVGAAGTAITYHSLGVFANNPGGAVFNQYVSTRGESGWSTQGISFLAAPSGDAANFDLYQGFTADLSQGVILAGDPPLDGATPGTANLYRRSADGSVQLITPGEPAGQFQYPNFAGGSADYSVLAFEDNNALTPGAGSNNVYEWAGGQLTLVNPAVAGVVGSGVNSGTTSRAVSADGSRIFWTQTAPPPTSIYVFAGGASTEITKPQCTGCTESSGGTYWTASTDGSKAFFTSTDRLTSGSTASPNGAFGDLYMYDAGTSSPTLTDLTVDHNAGDSASADVQGVIGASNDGSYVYFVANGVLASGAAPGTCGSGGAADTCNLYLWHGGTTTFIATVEGTGTTAAGFAGDSADWALTSPAFLSARAQVSADGLHLLYTSTAPVPAGYNDNAGHSEVYLYDASSAKRTCMSCNPLHPAQGDAVLAHPSYLQPSDVHAPLEAANNMSSDGTRVFFETNDALVPQDTNGTDDVYEWEADGTGTCATPGGCIALISSGRSPYASWFENAPPSGDDVFFLARDPLVAQDIAGNLALYDARVGGGFPPPTTPPPPCSGDVCHGAPTPAPEAPTAATITFEGPGNATSAPVARATVKVRHRVVHGTSFFVRVTVPASGVITISGRWLRSVRREVGKPGTYILRVALASQGRRALARRHRLKVKARIAYQPTGARLQSTTVGVTFVRRRR